MYVWFDGSHIPGRIWVVQSPHFPYAWHWGIEDWNLDSSGRPMMWHAQKNDIMRCTTNAEFFDGLLGEIKWTPASREQAAWVIERLQSIEGTPWNLVTANCEQMIRWAVEGRAHSEQLAVAVVASLVGALALAAINHRGNHGRPGSI